MRGVINRFWGVDGGIDGLIGFGSNKTKSWTHLNSSLHY